LEQDAAIQGFAKATMSSQPRLAAEWLTSMTDSITRINSLNRTLFFWRLKKAAEVEAWLSTTTKLTASEKAQLRVTQPQP